MVQALPLLLVVALVAVVSATIRRRSGVPRRTDDHLAPSELTEIAAASGRTTLVLFTAPGCAPCGPAREVLETVAAGARADVVSVDVSRHHALAESHRVMRAPTTFVVTTDGSIAARISGVPRAADLTELLATDAALRAGEEAAA